MAKEYYYTDQQIQHVKSMIWEGYTIWEIKRAFPEISLVHISRIRNGVSRKPIPWPDGSTGALPKDREREIFKSRRVTRRQKEGEGE